MGLKILCLLNSIHSEIGIFIFDQKVQERDAEVEDGSRRWTVSYCIIIITIMIITVYESGNDARLGNGPYANKSNCGNTTGAPLLGVIGVKNCEMFQRFPSFHYGAEVLSPTSCVSSFTSRVVGKKL